MVGGRRGEEFWVAIVGAGLGFVVAVVVEEGIAVVGNAIPLVALWAVDLFLGLFGES